MSTKKINIQLGFSAETTAAKAAIKDLQQSLNQVTSMQGLDLSNGLTQEIQNGVNAAHTLKAVLNQAFNTDTGKLDLGKFQQSLKQSGMTLETMRVQLQNLGPAGQATFMNLARSINSAEVPMFRLSAGLQKLGTTLMNTARWQLSSSMLTGLTSAISSAFDYAEELNESLNNIRIVTGYSTDKMSEFAIEANKAAKALSTTTTEYTNASLIYFQQGLSDSEVAERTAVTVKLANVTRESADTVSEWMTAVWNNFDDGSKSLEHYADVMTALGAATASSSDEIAEGLEKFAAISRTIGLSYEYAASALATVTAQTRQSADIVGTAFKTIFGRMEGLTLGETLDDGVTLNKYSEALANVGVNILNTKGELKDMDTILNELGTRWGTLSQAQKVALAQVVGGMRQYNQLIALMDNWGDFQENLTTATTSTGALATQADIYAESWGAAKDRVTAEVEEIYQQLIDDEFLVDATNAIAKIVDLISDGIEAAGGLKGVLLALGAIITSVFSEKIAAGIGSIGLGMMSLTKAGREHIAHQKQEAMDQAARMPIIGNSEEASWRSKVYSQEIELQNQINEKMVGRSQLEKDIFASKQEQIRAMGEESIKAAQQVDQAKQKLKIDQQIQKAVQAGNERTKEQTALLEKYGATKMTTTQADENVANSQRALAQAEDKATASAEAHKAAVLGEQQALNSLQPVVYSTSQIITGLANATMQVGFAITAFNSIIDTWNNDSLSGWEKFSQILMSVSMIFPVLINAYKLFTSETAKNTLEKIKNAAAAYVQAKAEEKLKRVRGEHIPGKTTLKEKFDLWGFKQQTGQGVKHMGNDVYRVTGKGASQYGNKGLIKTTDVKGMGMKGLGSTIKSIGPTLGYLAIAAAAVAAIVVLVKGLINWYNKANIAAERATKMAKVQTEAYQKAKEANDELNSSISRYEEGVKGLEELTRGTNEYQNAVKAANEEALKLIENNNSLAGRWQVNADGLIEFDEGALEEAQSTSLKSLAQQQNASIMAQQNAKEAQLAADETKLLRKEIHSGSDAGARIGNTAGGAVSGATIALLAGVAAAAIGGIFTGGATWAAIPWLAAGLVGGGIGAVAGAATGTSSKKEEEALADLKQEYVRLAARGDGSVLFADDAAKMKEFLASKGYSEGLINALAENTDQLKELVESNYELEQAELENAKMMVHNANMDKEEYADSKYAPVIQAFAAKRVVDTESDEFKQLYNKNYEKLIKDGTARNFELWNTYITDVMGAQAEVAQEGAYRFRDRGGDVATLQMYENGAWVDKGELSENDALEMITKAQLADLTPEQIQAFHNNAGEWDKGLRDSGLTDSEARMSIMTQMAGGKITDFSMLNEAQIEWVKSYLQKAGHTQDEITELIGAAVDNRERDMEDTRNSLSEYEQGILDSVVEIEKVSSAQYESIANAINTVFEKTGKEGADQFQKILESGNYTPEEIAKISEIIGSFDKWDSPYAMELLTEALQNAGLNIDLTGASWQDFITTMHNGAIVVNNSATALGTLVDTLAKVRDIIKDVNLGDIISVDDFEKLKNINPEIEKLFYRVGGGYQLVSEDLDNMLFGDKYWDDYKKRIDNATKATQQAQELLTNKLLWDKDTNKLQKDYSTNSSDYKNFINSLGSNVIQATGISKDAFLDAADENERAENIAKIEGILQQISSGEYSSNTLIADWVSNGVDTMAEWQALYDEFAAEGNEDALEVLEAYKSIIAEKEKELEKTLGATSRLNREVKNLERNIKNVGIEADRSYGEKRVKVLQAQLSMYDQLANAQTRIAESKKEELKTLREANKFNDYMRFDESGEIIQISYDADDPEDADDLAKWVSDYEAALDEMYDATEAAAQAMRDQFDAKLEALEYSIEFKVEEIDKEIDNLKDAFDRLDDKAFSGAESIANLTKQTGKYAEKMEQYADIEKKIFEEFGASSWDELMRRPEVDQQALIDLMGKSLDELKEIEKSLYDMDKQIADIIVESFREWGEEFDKISDKAKHLKSITDSYKNIVDLTRQWTNIDSSIIKKITDASVKASMTSMQAAKEKMDTLQAERKALQDELDAKLDAAKPESNEFIQNRLDQQIKNEDVIYGDTTDYWKSKIEELDKLIEETQTEFMGSWEETLQAVADSYAITVGEIFRDFEKQVTGSLGSFDMLQEYYDQQSKLNDLTVNDYEKIYELSKLSRKLGQDIEKTDNLKAKKELVELQEYINELSASEEAISKNALDQLQKRYDLKMAEIALEEAQKAKNQVSLARNASGGWGYVYTADQDAITNAEQNYEDKLYALQDFNQRIIEELQSAYLELEIEWSKKIREIYENASLSEEEKETAIKNTTDYYLKTMGFYSNQLDGFIASNKALYEGDWKKYSETTGYKISSNEKYIDSFKETIIGGITKGSSTANEAFGAFVDQIGTVDGQGYLGTLNSAYQGFKDKTEEVLGIAGTSFTTLGGTVSKVIGGDGTKENPGINNQLDSLKSKIETTTTAVQTESGKLQTELSNWTTAFATQYEKVALAIDAVTASLLAAKKAASEAPLTTETVYDNFTGDECKHDGGKVSATCTTGEKCSKCGMLLGQPLGHDYGPTGNAKICRRCKQPNPNYKPLEPPSRHTTSNSTNEIQAIDWATAHATEDQFSDAKYSIGETVYMPKGADAYSDPNNPNFWNKLVFGYGAGSESEIQEISIIDGVRWYRLPTVNGNEVWITEKNLQASSLDTGGYTGTWGPEGKFAMLHEKELVLNKEDTANFLSALGILQNIVHAIDLQATAQSLKTPIISPQGLLAQTPHLDQQVTIHAEFPNATNHSEIEEAFNNLINTASQYANRKE